MTLYNPFSLSDLTTDELVKLAWLRAVEWLHWPGFMCQPILPILFLYYNPFYAIGAVILLNVIWIGIRIYTPPVQVLILGAFLVKLKWVTIPVALILCGYRGEWITAILTAALPWYAGFLGGFTGGQIGVVQRKLLAKMGVTPEMAQFRETMDKYILTMRAINGK